MISIENFQNTKPINSPRSLKAMKMAGILLDDLLHQENNLKLNKA